MPADLTKNNYPGHDLFAPSFFEQQIKCSYPEPICNSCANKIYRRLAVEIKPQNKIDRSWFNRKSFIITGMCLSQI